MFLWNYTNSSLSQSEQGTDSNSLEQRYRSYIIILTEIWLDIFKQYSWALNRIPRIVHFQLHVISLRVAREEQVDVCTQATCDNMVVNILFE